MLSQASTLEKLAFQSLPESMSHSFKENVVNHSLAQGTLLIDPSA